MLSCFSYCKLFWIIIILSQILCPLEIISVQDAVFPFVGLVLVFFPPNFALGSLFSFLFCLQFSPAELVPENLICICSKLA